MSLRTRIWLLYVLQIALALGLVFVLLLVSLLRSPLLYRGALERLQLGTELVNVRYSESSPANRSAVLNRLAESLGVRLLIVQNSRFTYDSVSDQPALNLPEQPRPGSLPVVRDAAGRAWLFAARPLRGTPNALVVAAIPRPALRTFGTLSEDLLQPFLRVGVISLLLSLLVAWLVARNIAEPLQRLARAASRFPDDEAAPLTESGPPEVRAVIRAFNNMAARVRAAQESQRAFVANVSHELKTPLTSIQGFAQALLDGTADDPALIHQAAEVIYSEAARMYRMVIGLLDLARMDAGTAVFHREPVDIAAVLRGVAEKFRPQAAAAAITLTCELPENLLPVLGDGDRLAQVFTNLVDNAIRHTPPGGRVTLRGRPEPDGLVLEVADTGEGIPAEALPHIFERFYRVDSARAASRGEGAGLGLAIVHDIVKAHGGTIKVRSKVGQGSVFTVRLPFVAPDASTVVQKRP